MLLAEGRNQRDFQITNKGMVGAKSNADGIDGAVRHSADHNRHIQRRAVAIGRTCRAVGDVATSGAGEDLGEYR